jgi:uncharacterized membrane protein YbhN (UPF0104 family)
MFGLDTTSERARPRAIFWVVAFSLAAVLLYFSLRGVDWLRVWGLLREARLALVAAALSTISVDLLLRSLRWRVLLSTQQRVPAGAVFWATAAGYLGNSFLPARAGELVRTAIISRRSGLSRTFVLTTALCERIVDAIALILIGGFVLLLLPTQPGWLAGAAGPLAAGGLIGAAALIMVPLFEAFWIRLLRRMPVPNRFRKRAEEVLGQGLLGLRSFHDRGRLTQYLFLTGVIWFLDGVTAVVGARAIGLTLPLPVAFLLLAGLGLGSALPSTPGYVGVYQFVAVSVLTPFGFSQSDAIAHILLYQAMTTVVFLFWGLLGLSRGAGRLPKNGEAKL